MLILYSSAWKSVEAPLDQLCIIGSNSALAINVISFLSVYLSPGFPTLLLLSYHPTVALSSFTFISGKVTSHDVSLLQIVQASLFLPILYTVSSFS